MECYDRYFMIAVDLSFTGEEPRFEAVGEFCTALTPTTIRQATVCGRELNDFHKTIFHMTILTSTH